MKEYYYFSIGFEEVNWMDEEDQARRKAFVKQFTAPYGVECGFAGTGRIDSEDPMFEQFMHALEQYALNNGITFSYNCAYEQQPEEAEAEWFKYVPIKSIDNTDYQGHIICCNASNILPNIDAGSGIYARPFVSEKFKRVIEENGLTGLEFIWCKDIGKFAPPKQWYLPVATTFIGRGLDSPWVDIDSVYLRDSEKYPNSLGRIGVTSFTADCLRPEADLPRSLQRYLSLCDPDSFRVHYQERLLKAYLPTTDFAFGHFKGYQGFYISKRAKEVLISNHIISSQDRLELIQIVDKLPEGALLLDSETLTPPFYYGEKKEIGSISFEEIKELHKKEKELYDQIDKPMKKFTMKQILSLVNSERKKRPEDFCKRLSLKEIEKMQIQLPTYWVDLLKKTNGGYLSSDCRLIPAESIITFSKDKLKELREMDAPFNEIHISVAERADGDWYALLVNDAIREDCRIVQMTHEGGEAIREWESIAVFIYDMIIENDDND
ncbi:SMI1/KNR4 family protein [Paenibacillus aurantiacus]|uniref:SMI1/KNR4 family protein n=1 Tax=Paenibacillus aurantiacus TaxID=1936118 RepID=A0ABV5KGZ5_9BACL